MPPIQVLPEGLVNQIAAGEVVERPASVVKELLENAVDAQAARIRLEVEAAGKKLIRVSDDGTGMAPADAALALASHATSKIAAADDLEGITTLGFRGEALPSIASVADVRLVTRTAEAVEATEVAVSGGKASEPRPTSGPVGTTVEVRNLFRYVPARRKFLKTDATEMGHITEAVTRIALAYPSVHLTVTHNGRSVYELPPSDGVRRRVGAFFGADLAEALLEVASDEPAGRLWGLVGPPSVARSTAGTQYLFLNGRYVRDRSLLHALREAYRGLLEGRRQPVAFLFLTVPPERVDVNVHPTKIEVRLRDQHLLYGQILSAGRERLLGPGITPDVATGAPEAGPSEGTDHEDHDALADKPPVAPGAAGAGTDEASDKRADRVRRAVADFLRSPPARHQERLPLAGRSRGAGDAETARRREMTGTSRSRLEAPAPRGGEGGETAAGERASHEHEEEPAARAVQLHNTYLVAESDDGILIVDQHALHERVLFEQMMDRLEAGPLASQRLLVPVTLAVSDREMAAVEQHREALAHLGIEVEAMGPRDVGIQAFPPILERADPAGTLRDFLEWVLALDTPPTPRQVLESLVHVAACRAAVKAGEPLQAAEIEALLAHREAAEMASTCPHGRPAALMLRRKDLEKQFGRDYAAPARRAEDESLPF
ncbi:MAG: DNA mismatch repair endonuclease MutL [Phycisphaerae bacterium]